MQDSIKKPNSILGRGRWILVGLALVAAFGLGLSLRTGQTATEPVDQHDHAAAGEETIWTCSMHPQIKLPKPGKCPICFMDLIPLEAGSEEDLGPRDLVLTETAVALAEIQTSVVESRPVSAPVPLIGKIAYDETLYRVISARVPGRLDTLFVDYTGARVKKGQRLASLYSPPLYAAQSELLNAIKANEELQGSTDPVLRRTAIQTVASARERLKLWGLTEAQIESIARSSQARDHLDIAAPTAGVVVHKAALEGQYVKTGEPLYTVADLSRVWVVLNAYESDLAWLAVGQTLDFSAAALPGSSFSGRIIFIDPVVDPKTRTIEVRVAVDNPQAALKPGMFVNAVAQAHLDSGGTGGRLVIPATAPLITGRRAVVYVRRPDREKPTFAGRMVLLGPRVGDYYVVESGLSAGEVVVTRGNFKIDSALQIQAKPSMMNPAVEAEAPESEEVVTVLPAPEEFRTQLGQILAAYLQVQSALAADDNQAARQAADQAERALSGVDMELLAGAAHRAWMKDQAQLSQALLDLKKAPDLKVARKDFEPASRALWESLRRFGYQEDNPVRKFHCPMAFDNAGADWIQMGSTTSNPYFGSTMLRCGSQIDSLATEQGVAR